MNRKQVIAGLAFAAIGSAAFAQEATSDAWMNAASSRSSDQVRAELFQARKDGSIKATSAGYMEKTVSVKSRQEVSAEAIAARHSGELAALGGEAQAFAPAARQAVALVGGSR